jgi:hypothetical protein
VLAAHKWKDFNENFTINDYEILQPVFKTGDEQLSCFIWLYSLHTDFPVLTCQRLKLDKLSFCTCQCCSLCKSVATYYYLRWSPTSKTWGKPIAAEYKYQKSPWQEFLMLHKGIWFTNENQTFKSASAYFHTNMSIFNRYQCLLASIHFFGTGVFTLIKKSIYIQVWRMPETSDYNCTFHFLEHITVLLHSMTTWMLQHAFTNRTLLPLLTSPSDTSLLT